MSSNRRYRRLRGAMTRAQTRSGRVGVTVGLVLTVAGRAPTQAQQSVPAGAPLVFEGVTVVDVERGQLVPNQRVVVVGNRIQTVGSIEAGQLPKDARVVEARGKYLIPGLWDMHVHTATLLYTPAVDSSRDKGNLLYPFLIANGITGMRDAHSSVPLETMVAWRQQILAGTRVGPPRQLLTGSDHEIHISRTEELTESDIRSLKDRGANFLKLYPFKPAAAAAAKRAGLPFGGHLMALDPSSIFTGLQNTNSSAFEASDSGMKIFDHMVAAGQLDSLCWGGHENASAEACKPLVERMRKNGTWLVPTLLVYANDEATPTLMGPASLPVADRFRQRVRDFWDGSFVQGNWLRDPTQAAAPAPGSAADGYMHIMREVGMPILAGTDTRDGDTTNPMVAGFSLHAELAILAAEGLSPLEVLRSATLNPAKVLAGTDSLGTVAPGKLADLVLLDADPLADITNTVMIRAVVANGRYFDRAALDRMLEDVRAAVRKETP